MLFIKRRDYYLVLTKKINQTRHVMFFVVKAF